MNKFSVKETLGLTILLLAMSACQKNVTTLPNKTAAKHSQDTEQDGDFEESSSAFGAAAGDPDVILFLAPFRLPFRKLPPTAERQEKGAIVCRELLTGKDNSQTLAQKIVLHGPAALQGFMDTARSSSLTDLKARQVLMVLAYMPAEAELEQLYKNLQPTILGRLTEQQLISMKNPALQFLLAKIDADPTDSPALAFRISKKLLVDAHSSEIDTILMKSKGPGRWALLELALSVQNRSAERRIKESLFFGTIQDRLKAIQALRASPDPLFQDFLRSQLDYKVANNSKQNLELKVEAIRTLAQFRDLTVIPKLIENLKNEKILGYESLKALKQITRKQRSKKAWFEWWEQFGTVHANLDHYRLVALSPRMESPTRIRAIRNLGEFYDYSITMTLVALFIDLDEEVQLEAIRQSANCKAEDVAPALVRLLDHKRDSVVRAAHLSLQRVTKKKFGRSKAAWESYLKSEEANL